ncbi:hypothetical protein GJV85_09040 [Sulfurimonas aquatica]|uniref:Uncharacterized protein n=1 Tax=Sulfurimonas aquatica TaxID=2672570 RepID=A0A975B0Z7_9BACT|nr:hypothetical protein [Sulfurimonas aquatica]QSZ42244.1 hypothetical protein GJV85_09040 [Sulfurimonas aquatica]
MKISISAQNIENIELLKELLKTDESSIINQALEEFFANEQKKLLEKDIDDENRLTNLDYDEFWDGVDI